ncbi:hypothetical protein INS49_015215 [Diaporthe citri]|uniref:uncharacterized protein n=1 Tax=Diaporthe citri TaxID=83186 RepID=UPI001C806E41|nr:uncharacterized protein INS49_015215 [Diaporthe citri]KAG6355835.1 hypothetical protein INS49_015215 [Diaporthe citri]
MPVAGQPLACIQVAANSSWRPYGDGMLALPMSPLDFSLTNFDDDVPGYEMTPDEGYAACQLGDSGTGAFLTSLPEQDNGGQIDVSQLQTPSSLLPFDITIDGVHEQPDSSNENGKGADTATTISSSIFSAELVNLEELLDLDKDTCSRTERATTVASEDDCCPGSPEAVYSATSLFGLKDFLVQNVRKSKASQVAKFIRELESVFGPPSMSPPDKYSERPRASVEDDFHEQKWCNALFQDPRCPITSFLTRSYVDEVLERSKKVGAGPLASAFAESIWAMGKYVSALNESGRNALKLKHEAYQSLLVALNFRRSVHSCASSLLKLQSLILLSMIACMLDETNAGELIAAAVFCARGLGVLDGRRTHLKASGNTEQQLVERAVLFLFSLEGGHSVDHGMPPMMSKQWLAQCYQLRDNPKVSATTVSQAELMSSILCSQYSPDALSGDFLQSAKDHLVRLEASMQRLNAWSAKNQICSSYADARTKLSSSKDPNSRQLAISGFYSYHLSIFFIHCPWIPLVASQQANAGSDEDMLQLRHCCIGACIHSAFATIELSNDLLNTDPKLAR